MTDSDQLSVKRSALNVERSASAGSAIDRDNPWPGLASFTEELRGFFFGREKETEELVRLVRRNTLTVLFGQSGLGKSSLLQAGAFPLLREADFLPLYLRLDHSTTEDAAPSPRLSVPAAARAPQLHPTLADQVKAALVDAFKTAGADAPAPRADESLWEYFHRKDIDIWSAKNRLLTPILAFDQFEEIFTLGRDDETRRERGRTFLAELADLVENRPPAALREKFDAGELDPARYNFDKPSCQVILSLREDFLPDLEGLKNEMRSILTNRMRVKRLNGTQALEIVSRPAPHLLAEGVAERIVEFVAGARGGSAERLTELEVEPALLSVICRELNERRRSLGQAQITADLVSGNRREILTDFYERSVSDLPEAMRTFVEDRLLTKSGFRDNLALETALETPGVTRPLLDTLVSRRLVRIEERAGVQRVELTHDVLAEVIRASRDARQQRLALEQARAHEQRALAAAARRTRRLRWLVGGMAAVIVALCVGAGFGLREQRRSAQRASQADMDLASRLFVEEKTSDGLAHLVRAVRRDPHNSILGTRIITTLVGHSFLLPDGPPLPLPSPALFSARYSADARLIYVQGEDQVIRAVDPAEWRIAREFQSDPKVAPYQWVIAKNAPGVLAVGLDGGAIGVFDTATGRLRFPPLRPPQAPQANPLSPVLSDDGRMVAAVDNPAAWVWDATSGALLARLPAYLNNGAVAFNPSGTIIATIAAPAAATPNSALQRVQLWSLPDGQPLGTPLSRASAVGGVGALGFTPDGKSLVVWRVDGADVFDVATRMPKGTTVAYSGGLGGTITPDSQRLIITGQRAAQIFDVATGQPIFAPLLHGGPIYAPVVSEDGKRLLTSSTDGFARLWDLQTGRLLAEPTVQTTAYSPAALPPDGSQVILFTNTGPALRLRIGGTPATTSRMPSVHAYSRIAFAAGAPHTVLYLSNDRATAFDASTGEEVAGGFSYPRPLVTNLVRTHFPADQKILVVRAVGPNGRGTEWRAWTRDAQGAVVRDVALAAGLGTNPTVSFSPDGQFLVGPNATQGLAIWSTETGAIVGTLRHEGNISARGARFSPDGRIIGYFSNNSVLHICDFPSGTERYSLRVSARSEITSTWRFSPDGRRIVAADNWGGVHIWDAADGHVIADSPHHRDSAETGVFAPDGHRFTTHSWDGTVQMWDVTTGKPVGPLLPHAARLQFASFSPDGKRLVTGTQEGYVRVWDVATGQPLTEPMRHAAVTGILRLEFSPDGKFFTTSGQNVGHRVWTMPPDDAPGEVPEWLVQLATLCAGKQLDENGNLTPATDGPKRDELRRTLAALPADAPYAEWARWFLADGATRSIAPGFTITPAEAEKLAAELAPPTPPSPATPLAP